MNGPTWARVDESLIDRAILDERAHGHEVGVAIAIMDLRRWQMRCLMPGSRDRWPGYRRFAEAWGWGEKRARGLVEDVGAWTDPSKADAWEAWYSSRQGAERAQSGAQKGRTKGAPPDGETPNPEESGRNEGAERAQDGAQKGPYARKSTATGTSTKEPSPLPPAQAGGVDPELAEGAAEYLRRHPGERDGAEKRSNATAKRAKAWLDRAGLLRVKTPREAIADALELAAREAPAVEERSRSPDPFDLLTDDERQRLVDEIQTRDIDPPDVPAWLDRRAAEILQSRQEAPCPA
jgi:hypothetical protein